MCIDSRQSIQLCPYHMGSGGGKMVINGVGWGGRGLGKQAEMATEWYRLADRSIDYADIKPLIHTFRIPNKAILAC